MCGDTRRRSCHQRILRLRRLVAEGGSPKRVDARIRWALADGRGQRVFDALPATAAIFTLLAAALHVLFFVLESLLFRRPFAWRTFGVRNERDAETIRDWALNQGFYNLFLAVGAIIGVVLAASTDPATSGAGIGMVLLATGSMLGAAVVLLVTKPALLRGAAIQGVPPLLAIGCLLFL